MHLSQVQSNPIYKKMSDINNLRNKMDAVTLEMINLLKTRTDIAKEIGEVKTILEKELQMKNVKIIYVEKLCKCLMK